MNWQDWIAYLLAGVALGYVIRVVIRQVTTPEEEPHCRNCPVPGARKSRNRRHPSS